MSRILDFATTSIRSMLDNNCPICITGKSSTSLSNGHAWIIDGYKDYQRDKYSVNTTTGVKTNIGCESRSYYHCNFGWHNGICNGYYIEKIFNTKDGPIETDPTAGDNDIVTGTDNYTRWFRTIKYTNPN